MLSRDEIFQRLAEGREVPVADIQALSSEPGPPLPAGAMVRLGRPIPGEHISERALSPDGLPERRQEYVIRVPAVVRRGRVIVQLPSRKLSLTKSEAIQVLQALQQAAQEQGWDQ